MPKPTPILIFVYYTPAIAWGILILYFSLLPQQFVPRALVTVSDLLLHTAIYAMLTFLLGWGRFLACARMPFSRSQAIVDLLLIVIASGAIEVVQEQFIPGRSGEWLDLLANFFGAVLGTVIAFASTNRFVQT